MEEDNKSKDEYFEVKLNNQKDNNINNFNNIKIIDNDFNNIKNNQIENNNDNIDDYFIVSVSNDTTKKK